MDDFPIGAIVAYAGPLPSGLENAGWMPCDGRALSFDNKAYGPIRAVIESSYGSDSTSFYLPYLAGYFLRGVDASAKIDSDANARGAPSKHPVAGATGAVPGSVQDDGVGPHRHSIRFFPNTRTANDHGDGAGCIIQRDGLGNTNKTEPTGGSETRPQNMAVYFLIKYKQLNDGSTFVPGMVIDYSATVTGDPTVSQGWMPCDGRALDQRDTATNYALLHDAIMEVYGATANGYFCVPDYRGMFLRGVDGGRRLDPDAAARTAPRPDLPNHGAAGDTVGSKQDFLLGAHTHPYIWQNENHCLRVNGRKEYMWQTVAGYTSGDAGDCAEVRPKNIAVNRLICWNPKLSTFQVPKGAVIAFAGPLTAMKDPAWSPCDGSSSAIPDYRGWFLRGADASRAVGTSQPDDLTKHAHGYFFTSGQLRQSDTSGVQIVVDGLSSQLTDIPGPGDTRPKNAAVHFLIKTL